MNVKLITVTLHQKKSSLTQWPIICCQYRVPELSFKFKVCSFTCRWAVFNSFMLNNWTTCGLKGAKKVFDWSANHFLSGPTAQCHCFTQWADQTACLRISGAVWLPCETPDLWCFWFLGALAADVRFWVMTCGTAWTSSSAFTFCTDDVTFCMQDFVFRVLALVSAAF